MKPGTSTELGKLALIGALAVSVAMIAQPLVEHNVGNLRKEVLERNSQKMLKMIWRL
jgi:hypothetical protein